MERAFVVLRSHGPGWDEAKPLEAQSEWTAHALFMDALFEQGFAALVGPLEGTRLTRSEIAAREQKPRARFEGPRT